MRRRRVRNRKKEKKKKKGDIEMKNNEITNDTGESAMFYC